MNEEERKIEVLANEARSIIDALNNHIAIGFADYILSILLAECVRRKEVELDAVPSTLVALHDPEGHTDELEAERDHLMGTVMLCGIQDEDLRSMALDILARLNDEQKMRDAEEEKAKEASLEYISTLIQ